MIELRVNEHYTSIQGEGPNVGKMTQFLRLSGCNMRCPGWPCDTPHAVLPALWKNDPKRNVEMLVDDAIMVRDVTGATHVCLTGGEPFLQTTEAIQNLVSLLTAAGFTVDIFTNGSFPFPTRTAVDARVTFVMDWKLPGSGEASTRIEVRKTNLTRLLSHHAVKFVVADMQDLERAKELYNEWLTEGVLRAQVYVGAVWGKIADDRIVEFLKQHQLPWLLNVQVHKYIWGEKRGV